MRLVQAGGVDLTRGHLLRRPGRIQFDQGDLIQANSMEGEEGVGEIVTGGAPHKADALASQVGKLTLVLRNATGGGLVNTGTGSGGSTGAPDTVPIIRLGAGWVFCCSARMAS